MSKKLLVKVPPIIYLIREPLILIQEPDKDNLFALYQGKPDTEPFLIGIGGPKATCNPLTLPSVTVYGTMSLMLDVFSIQGMSGVAYGNYTMPSMLGVPVGYKLSAYAAWEYWYKLNEDIGQDETS